MVFTAPAAIPPLCTGTADMALDTSVGVARPTPIPATMRPGTRCVQADPAPRPAWSRAPAPTSAIPPPMIHRGFEACRKRPMAALTTKADRDSGAAPARPASTGLRPSTVCSHSEL